MQKKNNKYFNDVPKIDDKYLLLCSVSKDFIKIETNEIFEYYHFCLETTDEKQNFGVWANGILSEAICKYNFIQKRYVLLA